MGQRPPAVFIAKSFSRDLLRIALALPSGARPLLGWAVFLTSSLRLPLSVASRGSVGVKTEHRRRKRLPGRPRFPTDFSRGDLQALVVR
jgi:hypothetical protein